MLDQNHLEQYHWVYTGPSVILAVQWFHHFIEPVKIYRFIYFSQQMSLRYQLVYDYELYHIYQKKPSSSRTFSTDWAHLEKSRWAFFRVRGFA